VSGAAPPDCTERQQCRHGGPLWPSLGRWILRMVRAPPIGGPRTGPRRPLVLPETLDFRDVVVHGRASTGFAVWSTFSA